MGGTVPALNGDSYLFSRRVFDGAVCQIVSWNQSFVDSSNQLVLRLNAFSFKSIALATGMFVSGGCSSPPFC